MPRTCALLLLAGIALAAVSRRPRAAAHPPRIAVPPRPAGSIVGHWSDCAVHNGPALPVGPCTCGGIPYPGTLH